MPGQESFPWGLTKYTAANAGPGARWARAHRTIPARGFRVLSRPAGRRKRPNDEMDALRRSGTIAVSGPVGRTGHLRGGSPTKAGASEREDVQGTSSAAFRNDRKEALPRPSLCGDASEAHPPLAEGTTAPRWNLHGISTFRLRLIYARSVDPACKAEARGYLRGVLHPSRGSRFAVAFRKGIGIPESGGAADPMFTCVNGFRYPGVLAIWLPFTDVNGFSPGGMRNPGIRNTLDPRSGGYGSSLRIFRLPDFH